MKDNGISTRNSNRAYRIDEMLVRFSVLFLNHAHVCDQVVHSTEVNPNLIDLQGKETLIHFNTQYISSVNSSQIRRNIILKLTIITQRNSCGT